MSFSSCSRMWHCHTYLPPMSKLALIRVIWAGFACTVSFGPFSLSCTGSCAPLYGVGSRLTSLPLASTGPAAGQYFYKSR